MDPELKARWLEALRSNIYTKGSNFLRYKDQEGTDRWCCLGVLCDVYSTGRWKVNTQESGRPEGGSNRERLVVYTTVYGYGESNESFFVPDDVTGGEDSILNLSLEGGYTIQTYLAGLNDASASFDPVIEFIEKEL